MTHDLGLLESGEWCCGNYSPYDPKWDFNMNVYMEETLLLLSEWDVEDCMDAPFIFYMR